MNGYLAAAILAVLALWTTFFLAVRRFGPGRAARRVRCPRENMRARVVVEQREGDFGSLRTVDVVACSLSPQALLSCKKECLAHL